VSSLLVCPVCRAQLEQGPQCRRCRADVSLLFALRDQRDLALATAYQCLARQQFDRALAAADEVEVCRQDEESRRLVAAIHLLRGNFAQAWQVYTEQTRHSSQTSGSNAWPATG